MKSSLLLTFTILPIAVQADNEVGVLKELNSAYPDWKPRGIVDVGGNRGGWTTSMQSKIYPGLNISTFMVEASPEHTQELQDVKEKFSPYVDFKITVLSGKDDDTVEFYSIGGTGDSMFKENTKHYDDVKPTIRKTAKLDTIVGHMEHIDYLKLDVQGAELMVLQGATETLKRTTFVQLEASVVEYNKGGACWFEIDDFLRKHGFYFYDSSDYSRNTHLFHSKGMGQFDVLYVKPTSPQMPKWLVDNKVSLCGSKREAGNNTIAAGSASSSSIDGLRSGYMGEGAGAPSSNLILLGFFAAFLFGYVAGKSVHNSGTKQQGKQV